MFKSLVGGELRPGRLLSNLGPGDFFSGPHVYLTVPVWYRRRLLCYSHSELSRLGVRPPVLYSKERLVIVELRIVT